MLDYAAAGIVLYHPDYFKLKQNLEAITCQVKTVYCYNNGLGDNNIEELLNEFTNVVLIGNGTNDGLSIAINMMASLAMTSGSTWFLTLDQDSVCQQGMLEEFGKYTSDTSIGAICPLMVDKRRPVVDQHSGPVESVNFCITSGCFMNLDVFQKIGKLDEYLFIGLIDNDYCHRLKVHGFEILRINNMELDHELGNLTPSRFSKVYLFLGELLKSEKIKALSYKRSVSPLRVYYSTRNIVYLSKKYPNDAVQEFSKVYAIKNGLSNVVRGQDKIKILKAFIKGYNDGVKH